ncbi:MAG: hypothetical protein WC829_01120 [Hyphomicrobium sp.]|jgi:hypothetical protein
MKTALITTTINVPTVLALYRKLGPDVKFFVAADEKTPLAAYEFCADIPNCEIYSPDRQRDLGYACSELLGWNNDSRRDIALLEAVKHGAEIVVSVDDDMIPTDIDFFERVEMTLSEPYSGLQLGAPGGWFDAGQFTVPIASQRGLPEQYWSGRSYGHVVDAQIGAMQGIILGIPDTGASTTMRAHPFVKSATDILRNGFVVDPLAKSVFNSQITAFRRELAPCFAQFYKWQSRNTDIFASLVMRRVMRERGLCTYFGPPTGFHNRSARDPVKDMEAEKWGMVNVVAFENCLNDTELHPGDSVAAHTAYLYDAVAGKTGIVSVDMLGAVFAFLDDMRAVL